MTGKDESLQEGRAQYQSFQVVERECFEPAQDSGPAAGPGIGINPGRKARNTRQELVELLHRPELHFACLLFTDGAGHPRALLRTTSVRVVPFSQVDAEHAAAEGEDDRTLESWRREHETYWRRVLPRIGAQFSPDLPVVLERFELRYPKPSDQ